MSRESTRYHAEQTIFLRSTSCWAEGEIVRKRLEDSFVICLPPYPFFYILERGFCTHKHQEEKTQVVCDEDLWGWMDNCAFQVVGYHRLPPRRINPFWPTQGREDHSSLHLSLCCFLFSFSLVRRLMAFLQMALFPSSLVDYFMFWEEPWNLFNYRLLLVEGG